MHGFVLESADSVRFGDEYTAEEIERNRQILFGELLCGLLMGEPVWTNAVFAFDSKGMVEVLGSISRAFLRKGTDEQFLPFIISAYPQDRDPWQDDQWRPWSNPAEFLLRCYAHRLKKPGFQLSATPDLNKDESTRVKLADKLVEISVQDSSPDLADRHEIASLPEDTRNHFHNLLAIDKYLRSWLGQRTRLSFQEYASSGATSDMPIRLIRENWQTRYQASQDTSPIGIGKLRFFVDQAYACRDGVSTSSPLFQNALDCLEKELLVLPHDDVCFSNRSNFRSKLRDLGFGNHDPTFRLLIELVDGHYVRTQYTELSHSAREVTSPASKTEASQIGESWAALTMQSCLEDEAADRPWQFINQIDAVPGQSDTELDLDAISKAFADFVSHPDRRGELARYHTLLASAREVQTRDGGSGDDAKRRFEDLQSHVTQCIDEINKHLSRHGVEFHFNEDDAQTCAGSLTLTFRGNRSTRQCTGAQDAVVGDDRPENDQASDVRRGSDNQF